MTCDAERNRVCTSIHPNLACYEKGRQFKELTVDVPLIL